MAEWDQRCRDRYFQRQVVSSLFVRCRVSLGIRNVPKKYVSPFVGSLVVCGVNAANYDNPWCLARLASACHLARLANVLLSIFSSSTASIESTRQFCLYDFQPTDDVPPRRRIRKPALFVIALCKSQRSM